ncbi:MAG: bacterial transcriptional activator domain-containing protein [Actinomycetota bacterium]|nr:bacterial transcriptional activator domain-containing protein [Actinomycetota bacterium]
MMTSESQIIIVAAIIALLCLAYIAATVVVATVQIARSGMVNPTHRRSWRTRLAKYLLVVTPIASIAMSLNQRHVSAQEVQRDIVHEDEFVASQVFESNNSARTLGFISTAVGAGLLLRLRSKRRQAERGDEPVENQALEVEAQLATSNDDLAVARLDLALRSLRPNQIKDLRMVITSAQSIKCEFVCAVQADAPWIQLSSRVIELPQSVELETLVLFAHNNEIVPLLFPVGVTSAGEVWINLDAVRTFGVEAECVDADKVWTGLVQSLSLSPFAHDVSVVGEESVVLPGRRLVIAREHSEELVKALTTEESAAVMLLGDAPEHRECPVLYRGPISEGESGLRFNEGSWILCPSGVSVTPVGCTADEIDLIKSLIGEGTEIETWSIERWIDTSQHPAIEKAIPQYIFLASILGRPEVRHRCGQRVEFEKSKSEELVMWLAMHSSQQRRSSARTDMWHAPIKDATFSNITSDVRRSLTVAELPPEGQQWLGVTLTDELPLHVGIVSDVEVLRACVNHARRWPEDGGIEVLRQGLGLVRGVPFESSLYIWCDSTGLASEVAVLVVRAAQMLAEMCAELGDLDGVYWATGKGLLAVPGHEDLVAQRMRLHAERQDQSALRTEWQGYCRALANDEWGDASPSRMMVELWRELGEKESYSGMTSGSIQA